MMRSKKEAMTDTAVESVMQHGESVKTGMKAIEGSVLTAIGEEKPKRRVGGSRKGIPNKTTTSAREAIIDVFNRIGGRKNFARWARENETEFYRHFARLIPTDTLIKKEYIANNVLINQQNNSLNRDQLVRLASEFIINADGT